MKSITFCVIVLACMFSSGINAQIDSVLNKIDFEMDFRFRAEQDWDSRRSDGTYRDDRSRLRYRFRTGATYQNKWYTIGFRIRTGDQNKQQDPQLTIGKGFKEFGTLPLGFEKIYFKADLGSTKMWFGKNTFPFKKTNELFWSDNVFPEGVAIENTQMFNSSFVDKISFTGAHLLLISNDGSFFDDAYMQGLQTTVSLGGERIKIFPALYFFRNIPDIPDGDHSFFIDYSIFHFGTQLRILNDDRLTLEFDYYLNFKDYSQSRDIASELQDEKTGLIAGLQHGKAYKAKTWMFKASYAYLQRFSILDFMSQNDWARWSYSANNSPDGRLSNLQGVELVAAYALSDKVQLIAKYYYVDQLVPYGIAKETNQRIRFDIDLRI